MLEDREAAHSKLLIATLRPAKPSPRQPLDPTLFIVFFEFVVFIELPSANSIQPSTCP
jgi:hypothetical protein